ncbi:MAG: recombinase family protein [Lachnospiraceae bacterium]
MDTDKKRVEQPREKWIVVEGQHEALVSQEVFKKANDNLVGLDVSGRNTGVRNLFFVCGYCGKGLRFSGRKKEKYLCRSRTQEAENDCQRVEVSRKEIEDAVLEQVRVMADMLMEERVVRREARKGNKASELDAVIADSTKELAQWKGTKMRLYEWYKSGEVSREEYMERIEKGRVRMEELERTRRGAQAELDRMQEVSGPEEISDEELTGLSELEVFDKDRLKTLIEKVVVYGEDAMEIVWKVRSPFKDGKTA